MDDSDEFGIPMWEGSFAEWRRRIGWSTPYIARFLECGLRKVQELDLGSPDYRLRRPDRIAMQAALDVVEGRGRSS
jgi:hypothetical protein